MRTQICHRLTVSKSVGIDRAWVLTEKREDCGHVSGDVTVDTEEIRDGEMSPIVAIPTCQQEVCSAFALPGVGPGEVDEPFQGRLHSRVRENFNSHDVILAWKPSAVLPRDEGKIMPRRSSFRGDRRGQCPRVDASRY
jgi:hypothetical protein